MRRRLTSRLLLFFCLSSILSFAQSQEPRSDINLGGQAFWPMDSSSSTLTVKSSIAGGGLVGYRLHLRGHSSAEVNYGYTRSTFYYTIDESAVNAGTIALSQSAATHQFTGDYVYNLNPWHRLARLEPFVLGGGGLLLFRPSSNANNTLVGATSQGKGALLYGAGVDYQFHGPFALRLQYRGFFLFHAPDFYGAGATGASHMLIHTPTASLVYRF